MVRGNGPVTIPHTASKETGHKEEAVGSNHQVLSFMEEGSQRLNTQVTLVLPMPEGKRYQTAKGHSCSGLGQNFLVSKCIQREEGLWGKLFSPTLVLDFTWYLDFLLEYYDFRERLRDNDPQDVTL